MSFFSQFFKSKDNTISQEGFAPYEEIDGKKTSKLGYFFLVLMVIFGVWQGNNFLNSLEKIVAQPLPNSTCLVRMENSLLDYFPVYSSYSSLSPYQQHSYYNGYDPYGKSSAECTFTEREKDRNVPSVYALASPNFVQKESLEKSLQDVTNQKHSVQNNRAQAVDNYSVSLLESIAQKNQIMGMSSLRATIVTSDDLLRSLTEAENSLRVKIEEEKNTLVSILEPYRETFKTVDEAYTLEVNVYTLKKFAVQLLFILPVFLFVWRRYSISKNNRSEFSLIWGGVVAMVSVLLAQILLVFVYEILPHELLQKVFAFLSSFKFFFVVAYWLGFILVPLFFGFLIYIIQKKYYNKKAITMRAFKANKCPRCSMSVASHMIFCSACGSTLKVQCGSCAGYTPNAGDYCELCGVKKTETPITV